MDAERDWARVCSLTRQEMNKSAKGGIIKAVAVDEDKLLLVSRGGREIDQVTNDHNGICSEVAGKYNIRGASRLGAAHDRSPKSGPTYPL